MGARGSGCCAGTDTAQQGLSARSVVARRGKNQAEAVGIAKPKNAHAPRVSGLGIERSSRALRIRCDGVDALCGGDLERESRALQTIDPLGAILLGEEDANRSCSQADRDQLAIALVFTVEREAEDVTIPGSAASNVGNGEGGTEVLGDKWRRGGRTGCWIVGHMSKEAELGEKCGAVPWVFSTASASSAPA